MIQELFGEGAGLLGEERKISITGALLETSPSPSPSPSPSSSTTTTTTTNPPSFDQQNLRCPRCDSSNTKFCYYNNYNLTQPRHFCKTCRRYWTKGGTLRNVPIGGGCRKNKSTTSASTTVGKSSAGKVIKSITNPHPNSEFNPILWGSPQNSQLLALLGATQNPNPNPNSFSTIKEERNMIGSHMMTSHSAPSTGVINARPITLDSLNQVPLWRNNQHQSQQPHHQYHHHHQQKLQQGLLMGETQNTGIQELYQRLRSSSNYNIDHSSPVFVTSTSSPTLEPSPIAGEELGYWNPTFLWSNQPTSNGTFP